MYINTKKEKLQESIDLHNELCETGNKLLRAINAQFPKLRVKLNKELLFEFFKGRQSPGESEFHRLISEKDILADTELKEKLEAEGRTLDVTTHLQLYPLNPFRDPTNELIRSFYHQYNNFRCFDQHIVEVDNEMTMSEGFEDFITGVYSVKLTDKKEIELYEKAESVAAILTDFLKEVEEANPSNRKKHISFDELFLNDGTNVKPTRSVIPRLLDEKIDIIVASRQRLRSEHEAEQPSQTSANDIAVRTMTQILDAPEKLNTGKSKDTPVKF